MDVVTLRVLAPKSKMNFGKFADMTVKDAIIADRDYLIWVYYHCSNISFNDEILNELEIIPIQKPGISNSMFFECKKRYSMKHFTKEQQEHYRFIKYRNRKRAAIAAVVRDAKSYPTKGALAWKNQGHTK